VKGKYGAKADRRREVTGLEDRAVATERERDRLAAKLAEVREHSEQKIAGLRAEARGLREQRDAAAAPRIAELEAANGRLRAQCRAVELMVSERARERGGGLHVSGVLPDLDLVDEISGRVHSRRGGLNPRAAALEVAGTMQRIVAEERRNTADARAELQEAAGMLSIYAYDTAYSSISIDWSLGPSSPAIGLSVCVRVESPAPGAQDKSISSAMILPVAELKKLAEAIASDPEGVGAA
jgi:hypothetical protein